MYTHTHAHTHTQSLGLREKMPLPEALSFQIRLRGSPDNQPCWSFRYYLATRYQTHFTIRQRPRVLYNTHKVIHLPSQCSLIQIKTPSVCRVATESKCLSPISNIIALCAAYFASKDTFESRDPLELNILN